MARKYRVSGDFPSEIGVQASTGGLTGKTLDWVREEANGRLIFRRRYPEKLKPFPAKQGTNEFKVPLGSNAYMTAAAFERYEQAKRRFDRDVRVARATQRLREKGAESPWDDPTA